MFVAEVLTDDAGVSCVSVGSGITFGGGRDGAAGGMREADDTVGGIVAEEETVVGVSDTIERKEINFISLFACSPLAVVPALIKIWLTEIFELII